MVPNGRGCTTKRRSEVSKQDFKTDPLRRRNREQEVTLTYYVEVTSFGHPQKLRKEIGKRLAREVGLQFTQWDVLDISTEEHFSWSPEEHNGGDPFGDWLTSEIVDPIETPNGDAIDANSVDTIS